jgi:NAD(P)-dependent dehydrogenase (short-subunit alcohol dehydrogenase family)
MNRDCIVVTGASRGIGATIALALAKRGHNVACLSRSGELPACKEVPPEVSQRWFAHKADVTVPGALADLFRGLTHEGWRITGLVNNAGIHVDASSAELTQAQWNEVMNMNATSVLMASQAVYPYLVDAGDGLIVNIGSFFDKLGVKRNLAYCASKAAVGAITRCLAVEWGNKGIRVINVAPGYIETDLNSDSMAAGPLRDYLEKRIPRRRPGTASEVGAFVAGLFAPECSFLTGETIYIDGGQGVAH